MSDQSNAEENPLITPTEQPAEEQAPAEGQEQPAETGGNEPSPPKKEAWYMKEIGALRAANQEKERMLREYQSKMQPTNSVNSPAPTINANEITPEFIDQLAYARATELAAAQSFNKICDDIFDKGATEFNNFKDAVESLGSMGALSDNQKPTPLLQAVIEVPNAHKVLHYLAQNPEEAQRIKGYAPLKQAIEVANISNKLSAPTAPQPASRVGAPIKPIVGNGKAPSSIYDTDIPMEEWMKLNEKHEQEARARRY